MNIIVYDLFFKKEIFFYVSCSDKFVSVSCSHDSMIKTENFEDMTYFRCFENLVLFCLTTLNLCTQYPIPEPYKKTFKKLTAMLRLCDQIGKDNISPDLFIRLLIQIHDTLLIWLKYVKHIKTFEISYVCESTMAFICVYNSLYFHFTHK